jgi:2'-5' RNA ligase
VSEPGARRLFFALWPDAGLRARAAAALQRLTAADTGRPLRPDQLHVTLAFLGAVAADRVPLALAAGAGLQVGSLELEFDRVEYWPGPRLLCLTASAPPPRLLDLVADLQRALRARVAQRRPAGAAPALAGGRLCAGRVDRRSAGCALSSARVLACARAWLIP